ncbi:unnamed protein product, partial [Urochloa humidicola]
HGRYALGDSTLDTASTPTLSQIRARSANPDIRQRPTAAQSAMQALQAQLEEERKRREELEARLEAQRQLAEAERLRAVEAERQRQQQMIDWYNWMNGVAQQMGQTPPPPPMMEPPVMPPPPPTYSPNFAGSATASNEAPADEDLSARLGHSLFGPPLRTPVSAFSVICALLELICCCERTTCEFVLSKYL